MGNLTDEQLSALYFNALYQIVLIIENQMLSDETRIIAIAAILRTIGMPVQA